MDEFNRKWRSQVKKGILSFMVLSLLRDKELYGYEFIELIKKQTVMTITDGTFYPLINRLKKEGLVSSVWVEQESGIPRKYYKLTASGESALKEMNTYWNDIVKSIKTIS